MIPLLCQACYDKPGRAKGKSEKLSEHPIFTFWQAPEKGAEEFRRALEALSPPIRDFFLLGLSEARSRARKGSRLAGALGHIVSDLDLPLPPADSEAFESGLRSLEPRAATEFRAVSFWETIPATQPELAGLTDIDFENLDRIFDEILPRQFAEEQGSEDFAAFSRPAQKAMARKVAETLGSNRFLLLDAPTGTGKTLAYLVPALLWAARCGVRVGISTFTRTLQEQAFDRELPRALKALEELGFRGQLRASLLKGRQNYLCWARVQNLCPGIEEPAEDFLAWFLLCLFSLIEPTGDLDRFQPNLPESLPGAEKIASRIFRLRREAVSARSCCRPGEGKKFCGADIARRRAERSHLTITNHAFVFAWPDFFRHLVFDEAEHLHAQALSSESMEFRPRILEARLDDLCEESPKSHAPLDLLRREGNLLAAEWGPRAPQAVEAWREAKTRLYDLRVVLSDFMLWRRDEIRRRDPKLAHSLLKSYSEDPAAGEKLFLAREHLISSGAKLAQCLDNLLEDLLSAPLRGAEKIRNQIARTREEIEEILGDFALCLPTEGGRFRFDGEFFYDAEEDPTRREEAMLCRRVLLPNSWLGKKFWPALESAALLSATAHLHGGFEATAGYLGLDRIDGRGSDAVVTFKAPDPFDYSRVLFAVPTDAPRFDSSREGRETFLAFTTRFVETLCQKTRGRCLVLFTNAEDLKNAAARLAPFFQKEGLSFWYQGMEGIPKEQLADRFRDNPGSVLFGLDTFWYGVDFPGGICEYVVLVKLPYGQLDRYHFAQREALGEEDHRKKIYLPRALAMFRQGFGRLMRSKDDRGVVFLLDRRVLESRNRGFLQELPGLGSSADGESAVKTLFAPSARCFREAMAYIEGLAQNPAYEP